MDYPTKMTYLVILIAIMLVSMFCFVRLRKLSRQYMVEAAVESRRTIRMYTSIMIVLVLALTVLTLSLFMKLKSN